MSLESFFNPKSIAVVGVSESPDKLGSVVFKNIIDANYKGNLYAVNPKNAGQTLYGKKCYGSVRDIEERLDLVVIVVPAKFSVGVVDDCIANNTRNISIITAGFGEAGHKDLEEEIYAKCASNNTNILGPNCLGHICTANNLNASFADGYPHEGNIAFISQSGAYCSAMMDWAREKEIGFSHFISIGNKLDLSELELLEAIKDDPETKGFIFYLESLKHGTEFIELIRDVSKTKPVIILEPGKSKKAQSASMSHTGSLAPNYRTLEVAFEKCGAIQVHTTREMFYMAEVIQYAKNDEFAGKLGILTNAGGVGVLTSDLCEENGLDISSPNEPTIEKLKAALPAEAAFGNPIDVIGDARADRYEAALDILCESGEYRNILVLLTPQRVTEPKETAEAIVKISQKYERINIFASFIGGVRVKEGIDILRANNIIYFDDPADATRVLGLLRNQERNKESMRAEVRLDEVPSDIEEAIKKAKDEDLASLPQEVVNRIMQHYGLDYPKSDNFITKDEALEFCKKFFPNPLVLKLSAPDALHKTEMKGIYLNIKDEASFNEAWNALRESIDKFELKNASILIQEQIVKSAEAIIGVNSDSTFGRVMIFGSGGIYTEVMKDTSLRVLPTADFDNMIKDTKIGTILNGVRGEKPKAVKELKETLEKIQKLSLELRDITSIDINPILITEDRAVIVDFKMLLK